MLAHDIITNKEGIMLIRGKGGKDRENMKNLDFVHKIFKDVAEEVFDDKTSQFTILDMKSPCLATIH